MLVGTIKNDFINGIGKIAQEKNVNPSEVQIRLTYGESPNNPLKYHTLTKWDAKTLEESTFKKILDLKLDLIGKEGLVVPYILQAMALNMQELGVEPQNFVTYLVLQQETIFACFYDGNKPLKNVPIEKLF